MGLVLSPAQQRLLAALPSADLAARADFLRVLRRQYVVPDGFIRLEHGYYSIQAHPVLER